mmetsp:Transcript_3627/g.8611  ORF Transcript_3627/g.8611 Transcript_3627/m.8611 type:complete len:202 (+) Transcript_3627:555-1160(+)
MFRRTAPENFTAERASLAARCSDSRSATSSSSGRSRSCAQRSSLEGSRSTQLSFREPGYSMRRARAKPQSPLWSGTPWPFVSGWEPQVANTTSGALVPSFAAALASTIARSSTATSLLPPPGKASWEAFSVQALSLKRPSAKITADQGSACRSALTASSSMGISSLRASADFSSSRPPALPSTRRRPESPASCSTLCQFTS